MYINDLLNLILLSSIGDCVLHTFTVYLLLHGFIRWYSLCYSLHWHWISSSVLYHQWCWNTLILSSGLSFQCKCSYYDTSIAFGFVLSLVKVELNRSNHWLFIKHCLIFAVTKIRFNNSIIPAASKCQRQANSGCREIHPHCFNI